MRTLTALAAVAVVLPSANAFLAIAPAHVQTAFLSRTRTMSVSETRTPALRMPGGSAPAKRRITTMSAATLDDSTEWTLSMSFAKDGSTAQDLVTAKVKFMEDEGYEPPQGRVLLDGDSKYLAASSQCFWKLGEDPAKEGFDKAGFWIWGLFEEPAYPFFFFELDIVEDIPTAGGVISKGKLFGEAQVTRSKDTGVSLSQGKLTVKEYTDYQADLIGLSSAKVGTDVACGTFTARPAS